MAYELDIVQLKHAMASADLPAGACGTIVHVYSADTPRYLVEFSDDNDGGLETLLDLAEDDFDVIWLAHQSIGEDSISAIP